MLNLQLLQNKVSKQSFNIETRNLTQQEQVCIFNLSLHHLLIAQRQRVQAQKCNDGSGSLAIGLSQIMSCTWVRWCHGKPCSEQETSALGELVRHLTLFQ